jgi:hypothetical protein
MTEEASLYNQQVTVNEVTHHFCITNGFAHEIIQD